MKQHNIILRGYGTETHYLKLSQEQFDWWHEAESNGFPIQEYIEDPSAFEDEIPVEVDFLRSEDGEILDWKNGISLMSFYSPSMDSCSLVIENEDGVVFDTHISHFFDDVNSFEWDVDQEEFEEGSVIFISENCKGDVFHGTVEDDDFSVSKIKFYVFEASDGEAYLTKVFYDGKEVLNKNSSTVFKGISYGFCNEI